MQALGRVRNHQIHHVFCDKRQAYKSLNPDIITSKWMHTHQHDIALMNLNFQGKSVILNADYQQLLLLVTQMRYISLNDFYQQFALLALDDGVKLSYSQDIFDLSTQQQLRQFKKNCVEQGTLQLNQAHLPLTAAQLLALARKPRKTMDETHFYKKQQLIGFYNLSAHDESSITAIATLDNNGRFKKQLLSLELAIGDKAIAQRRFNAQFKTSHQFAADLTHFNTLQLVYKKLLKTLHITFSSEQIFNDSDYHYTKDIIIQSGFIDWVEQRRAILQGIISLPSKFQLQHDPLRFLSVLLNKMGLKQKRVGRAALGRYCLDTQRINLLNALVHRRAQGLVGMAIPIDILSYVKKSSSTREFFVETFNKIKRFFLPVAPGISVYC